MQDDPDLLERERGQAAATQTDATDEQRPETVDGGIAAALDIDTWSTGVDWQAAIERLKVEISSAVGREEEFTRVMRTELLPKLNSRPGAPPEAGIYQAEPSELATIHEGLLFAGRVDAVDGTSLTHDTLPLGITQLGVAVVSYGGTKATFSQRVYRKEITAKNADPVKQVLDVIDQRSGRPGVGQNDGPSELRRRGIMTYAERKILLDRSTADWRIGHGQPAPYELITGSGDMELLAASLDVLRRLILDFQRFVFVASAPNERGVLTVGNALAPGEYVVLNTIEEKLRPIVEKGKYHPKWKRQAEDFVAECGSKVLHGVYRASEHSPPYVFYGHRDRIHMAAAVALADSILRPARGFPMLIDVADTTCASAFGAAGFYGLVYDAYAQAGVPFKYLGEREMRR